MTNEQRSEWNKEVARVQKNYKPNGMICLPVDLVLAVDEELDVLVERLDEVMLDEELKNLVQIM